MTPIQFTVILPPMMMACLLLQSCQYDKTKAIQSSEAASYNTQLGLAYLKQGLRARAKRKLLTALKQAPNSPEVNASMAWFMEQSGELENAQRFYQKAMAAAPRKGAQLNNYGAFLCRRGQYKQADTYFLKAIRDVGYEHTAGSYENAGLCAAAIPEYSKAAVYFKKALEQDPSRKQSLYEWVNIEVKLGHQDKACSILQEHESLAQSDPALVALATKVSQRSCGLSKVQNIGVKHEYTSNSG